MAYPPAQGLSDAVVVGRDEKSRRAHANAARLLRASSLLKLRTRHRRELGRALADGAATTAPLDARW